jgi:hypothetical protein
VQNDSLNFVEVKGIQKNGRTLVRHISTGDFTTAPTGTPDAFGYIFADLQNEGGSTNRRFASTEYASESTSPWSVTTPNEFGDSPTSTYTNGNLRRNTYGTTDVIIEGWYDDRQQNWGLTGVISILIFARLGFWSAEDTRTFSDTEIHLWSDGEQASFST